MPRGRHRHSPPLHKILPPSVVAGVSVVGAAGAWLLAEPLVLRGLVAAVAAAAVTGAYLMRSWDRAAGLRVAELTRARVSDEWRAEERIAELEQDLEESRELRTRLETKLRRKRVELAGLRGEHAGLLRRYANAETERASALEGRRQLAIEAAAPKELLPARSTPTPESYRRADEALMNLTRNAALQETRRTVEAVRRRQLAVDDRHRDTEADGPQGKHAAATGAGEHRDHQHRRPSTTPPAPAPNAQDAPNASTAAPAGRNAPNANTPALAKTPGTPALPSVEAPASIAPLPVPRAIPAASAVVPYAARRHLAPQGNFDFFGTQHAQSTEKANAAIESVQNEDLADVVGEEALAAHRTGAVDNRAVGKVIDLTAHDETEQIEVAELRGAVS
ncbi:MULTISPECIES: hypothetical protein [unclassified Streptomyces]|uniref:hypothetical protein n=1 Tax=unclassified Streptomyces TaxID=2593676 RepID=UPI001B36B8CE|nr:MULTISPECIES: hypothetical protein [unclassified Streptomyces]MBQ1107249.1 hypothetical protein [Streptomyces sp. 404i]MBQ1113370.1 hypothetical protein [Streptomyces sp. C3-3]